MSENDKDLFQRTHDAVERQINKGKVGEPPLGKGPGERPGLGGKGGGQDPDRPGVREQLDKK